MITENNYKFNLKKELRFSEFFFFNFPLTKKNAYDKITKMVVEGRVNMKNLFVTSTEYAKVKATGTTISISKNKYNFYMKTGFIII